MSNSNDDHQLQDEKIVLMQDAPIPQGGYGLVFSEEMAAEISQFTETKLFKDLKRIYGLQKKDNIGRQCLQSANDEKWLHYFKGMAACVDLFFKDMESTAKEYRKAQGTDTDDDDTEE